MSAETVMRPVSQQTLGIVRHRHIPTLQATPLGRQRDTCCSMFHTQLSVQEGSADKI